MVSAVGRISLALAMGISILAQSASASEVPQAEKSKKIEAVDPAIVQESVICEGCAEAEMPIAATVDPREIGAMLRAGAFDKLTARLEREQLAFEAGTLDEDRLIDTYQGFMNSDPALVMPLDAWVEAMPDSFAPWLARAAYFHHGGWVARGTRVASETPAQRFERVGRRFELARHDLQAALERRSTLSMAYGMLVNIGMAGVGDTTYWYEAGIEAVPQSAYVRRMYRYAFRPEWSPDPTPMRWVRLQLFLFEMERDDESYPSLTPGTEDYERGRRAEWNKDVEGAFYYFDLALQQGKSADHYLARGKAHAWQQRYDLALADLNEALKLDPHHVEALAQRAYVYRGLDNFDLALADLRHVTELDPYDPRYIPSMVKIILAAGLAAAPEETEAETSTRMLTRPPCLPENVKMHQSRSLPDKPTPEQWKIYCSAWAPLERALVFGAEDDSVREARGLFFFFTLRWAEKAREEYHTATLLAPNEPYYQKRYTMVLDELGDCRAEAAFEDYVVLCESMFACDARSST